MDSSIQSVPKGKHTPTLNKILCACAQSCLTLGNPMDCSPPGFSIRASFFRQEYWNRLLFPTPGDHPSQEPDPRLWCLLHWQVDSLPLCHLGSPKKCDIFFSQNERKKYDHFHDTKKAFDKIQHPFMVKTLNKFGTEGTSLKKIKLYRTSPELILHM